MESLVFMDFNVIGIILGLWSWISRAEFRSYFRTPPGYSYCLTRVRRPSAPSVSGTQDTSFILKRCLRELEPALKTAGVVLYWEVLKPIGTQAAFE